MFLTKKKSGSHYYLYLVKTIPKKGKQKARQEVVTRFGRWEEVSEEMRAQFNDAKAKKALEIKLGQEALQKAAKAVKVSMNATKAEDSDSQDDCPFNKGYPFSYGHLAVRAIWDHEFRLRYKVDYLQKNTTQIKDWRINDVLFYLCATKILYPSSYLSASISKSNFLYCPWNSVTQDNFYRVLDFVYDNREGLLKHAVKNRLKAQKTEVEVAFFDCTNTWFETPYDDCTWAMIRHAKETRKELEKEGYSAGEIETYLKSDYYAKDLSEALEAQKDEFIRMRGKSKEGRFAQPIVTVALAIDQTGFPIDCKVFAGNISELKTIKPMLESLKEKYDVKDAYFVADRGLNSAASLDTIRREKLGFIVAQKVSRQKAKDRKEMLDLTGYRNCTLSDDGEFSLTKNETLREDAFRFKVCDHVKEAYVTDADGKTKKIKLNCKIVYTYSPERKARDLADLESQIMRANQAVAEGKLIGNPYGTGWRALVKTAKEAASGKEDKELYRASGLKEDVIAERRTIAGYAAVVYDHPAELPENKVFAGHAVLTKYHQLVNIEDSFRVMKSNFDIRPMHVRLHERIVAHCYMCVFALMMLRSVQEKLAKAGTRISSEAICDALSQALVVPIPAENISDITFMNIALDPKFHSPELCRKSRKESGLNELLNADDIWHRFKRKRAESPDNIDKIFIACGLKPLKYINTMGDVKIRLGLKSVSPDLMIAPEHVRYLQELSAAG